MLASLSIRYRLWSQWGCCLSGVIECPSSFWGHSLQRQICRSRWCRVLYWGQSASHAAKTSLQHLKLTSAGRTLLYPLSALGFCFKARDWSTHRSTMFCTSWFVCRCSSSRFWGILRFFIRIDRRATIKTLCLQGIWWIFGDRLPIAIYTGRSVLSPAKIEWCVPSDMSNTGVRVSHTLIVDLTSVKTSSSSAISP